MTLDGGGDCHGPCGALAMTGVGGKSKISGAGGGCAAEKSNMIIIGFNLAQVQ